jgi:hypothetical protein
LYGSEFTGIFKTGHSIITARISDIYAGTGRLFLASENDNLISNIVGGNTYNNINKVLFSQQIIIQQPAPILYSVSPIKASHNTYTTLSGRNLFSVNNIIFNNGVVSATGTIVSKTNTQINCYPPFIASGIGYIQVISAFGASTLTPFTGLPVINISGTDPSFGYVDSPFRVSGSGLASVTGLLMNNLQVRFSGAYENNHYFISGIVVTGSCCGETVNIIIKNEADTFTW